MMKMVKGEKVFNIDFSQCKESAGSYGGAGGKKKGIIYNGENYMLKFPQDTRQQKLENSYSNSSINEYIACHIFQSLGIETQETLLGTYNSKIIVACKDFTNNGYTLRNFYSLKNSVLNDDNNPEDTELNNILQVFDKQTQFPQITAHILKKYFWEMFIVDAFLANNDRHNGNWGFLTNLQTNDAHLAPIYDCASCLFPLDTTDEQFKQKLKDTNSLIFRVEELPFSIFRIKREKINYYNFLAKDCYDRDCLNALIGITERIDMKAIHKIIDETPYISDLNKEFLKVVVLNRKEKLLEKAILENKNISRLYVNETDIPSKDFAGFEFTNTSGMDKIRDEALVKEQSSINTQKPTKNDGDKPDIDEDKPSGPSGPRM